MEPVTLIIRGICILMTVLIVSFFATLAVENHGIGIVFLVSAGLSPFAYLQWRFNRRKK